MSTELSETIEDSDMAGQSEAVSQVVESDEEQEKGFAEEKSEQIFEIAEEAFEEKDYVTAVESMGKIPEIFRSERMQTFYREACRLRHVEVQLELFQKNMDDEKFDIAVASIEVIPEEDRDQDCLVHLAEARLLANADQALRAARKRFAAQNYEEAIRILEELPKEARPDSVIEVLLKAHSNIRKLADLWNWIDESWKQAQDSASWDDYKEILPLLDEVLAIRSKDTVAIERIKRIGELQTQLRNRDALLKSARRCWKRRSYESAIERLETIDEDIRDKSFIKFYAEVKERLELIEQQFEVMANAIREKKYEEQQTQWETIDELLYYSTEQFLIDFPEGDFEQCLTQIVTDCEATEDNDDLVELLDRYLSAVSGEWIALFLGRSTPDFLKNYPSESSMLAEKLGEFLNRLYRKPELISERLDLIRPAESHLGRFARLLTHWDEFLKAADVFGFAEEVEWSPRDRWIESSKSLELDWAACALAKVAVNVLPSGDERWEHLRVVGQLKLDRKEKPFLRVYEKMADHLEKPAAWPSKSLVPFTPQRIAAGVGGVAGVAAIIFGTHIAMKLLFGIGGLVGYGMTLFLVVLWAGFCFIANKLL